MCFMASINNTRSTKIQELRGLATIAVVFIHTTPGGMAQVICRPFLNFSVGIFPFLGPFTNQCPRRIKRL